MVDASDPRRELDRRAVTTATVDPKARAGADPETIGRYTVLGRLGAGGMGVVYVASDAELDRKVAIKLMLRQGVAGSAGPARLRREAQALAKLSHPHVVHVYEVGEHDGQVYIAMEFVQGKTLRAWQLGDCDWRDVVKMYAAAGRGLAAAHAAGLVHRDFKPDNVLVGADGRPRVLDFGLARPDAAARAEPHGDDTHEGVLLTQAGAVIGTPAYMPPEQLAGEVATARSDQFSFCVALFEALYGTRPFSGKSFEQLRAAAEAGRVAAVDPSRRGVPVAVHAALLVGLRPDPTARHPDMGAMLKTLEQAARTRRRSLRRLGVVAISLAALTTAGLVIWRERLSGPATATAAEPPATDARADILASSALPPVLPTPLPHDPWAVTVHRLDNGLTLYVVPRRDQPMVHASIAVRLGADDEPSDQPGLHHVAAHMLDSGSTRLGTLDPVREAAVLRERDALLQRLEQAGDPKARMRLLTEVGELEREAAPLRIDNERAAVLLEAGAQDIGFRSRAGLVLRAQIPAPALGILLALEADRMRAPSFRGFLGQTRTVLAEARRAVGGSDADLFRARDLLAPAVGPHPTPVREAAYVSSLPFAAITASFRAHFVPNNVALVLVGDVDADAALARVRELYGAWEPAALNTGSRREVERAGSRSFDAVPGVGGPRVTLAFALPVAVREDRRALLLLADILRDAAGDPDGPLPSAATLDVDVEARTLVLRATPTPRAELDDIEPEVIGVLEDAATGHLDARLADEAIAHRELRFARMSADPAAVARAVADSYIERRAWDRTLAELSAADVGAPFVAMTARGLLDTSRAVVHRTDGRYTAPVIPALAVAAPPTAGTGRSAFATALLEQPRSEIEPQFLLPGRHFRRERADRRAVVTVQTPPPLFVAAVRYPIGIAHDWWACDALQARLDPAKRRLVRDAVGLDVQCDRNATSIRLEGADDRFDSAWDVVLAALEEPTLRPADVRAHAEAAMLRRQRRRADPEHAFASLRRLAMWERGGGVEHARPSDGALAHADPAVLQASLDAVLQTAPDVAYAGPQPDAIAGRLPTAEDGRTPERRAWRARRPRRTRIFVVDAPPGHPARLSASVAAPAAGTPVLRTLFAQLVSTGAARLRGAEAVRAGSEQPPRGDACFVASARAPASDVPTRAAQLVRLLAPDVTPATFAAAVDAVESHSRAFRHPSHDVPATVLSWAADVDPRMAAWEQLGTIDEDSLADYARAAAKTAPVLAIGADLDALDLAALRRLGDVTIVDVADLVH